MFLIESIVFLKLYNKVKRTIMNDKKNENEKIMKYISSKLKDGEIPLMLQEVALFAKANKQDAHMIITSSSLYFVQNLSIKKYCKATSI